MKAIKNIKLVTTEGIKEHQAVVFDELIREITAEDELCSGLEVMDGGGAYLSAGFIDLHIHGCAGYDVMDDDDRALAEMAGHLVSTGVTAFLPTTMTMERARLEKAFGRIKKAMTGGPGPGAHVLGCNLEGPFISPKYKGAHDEQYITRTDWEWLRPYLEVIRVVTVAPEIEGSLDFIRHMVEAGVVVALGHTSATYEEMVKGIAAGASLVTHLFNGMTPFHHRAPGAVGAALLQKVNCELIVDNIHVVPAAQQLALKLKGVEQLVLVSDAMRACRIEDGTYDLGGQVVRVRECQARLENGTLAGSTLVLKQALYNFRKNTGLSLEEVIKLVTLNPARILRLENRKGSIAPGNDADLVLWDEEFNILMTIVAGERVYTGN